MVPSSVALASYHIDHIISEKQGGATVFSNLALACRLCNLSKGSSIAAYRIPEDELVRLFNPRRDKWSEHFLLRPDGFILPKTPVGEGTIKVLNLNDINRAEVRSVLLARGLLGER
nr:HNH endonuclease signature motif containing protein [Lewinella sp. W8]